MFIFSPSPSSPPPLPPKACLVEQQFLQLLIFSMATCRSRADAERSLEDLEGHRPWQDRAACHQRDPQISGSSGHPCLGRVGIRVDHWPLGWQCGVHKAVSFGSVPSESRQGQLSPLAMKSLYGTAIQVASTGSRLQLSRVHVNVTPRTVRGVWGGSLLL